MNSTFYKCEDGNLLNLDSISIIYEDQSRGTVAWLDNGRFLPISENDKFNITEIISSYEALYAIDESLTEEEPAPQATPEAAEG